MQIPASAPLSEEQRAVLNSLLPGITPAQLQWLAGFFTGIQSAASPLAAGSSSAGTGSPPGRPAPSLSILFGSESGNAQSLAQEVQRFAAQRGFRARVRDMANLSASDLSQDPVLLLVTSTWGDGDPPENAADLHRSLMSPDAPRLDGIHFSVCALGDTGYGRFCQTGKDFDHRLEELGAQRLHDRADCDVDYEPTFRAWLRGVFDRLDAIPAAPPESAGRTAAAFPAAFAAPHPAASYGKSHPFPAPLREKILLSGRGSIKEVWHLEFSLASSGFHYEPGDSLAVIPTNAPDTVDALLSAANLRRAAVLPENEATPVALSDLLQQSYDITTLSRTVLAKFNEFARSAKLDRLLHDAADLKAYLDGRQIVDLLDEFPIPNLSAEDFLSILRKLPPRLYSIASSQRAVPDEVHLAVAALRFESHGRQRKGVASTCLADMVEIGSTTPVYIMPNRNFKLPADPALPIVMIGPGTGVAPFRAFIQERRATHATGPSWLFFGDQHYLTDFLYQLEWQEALKDGVLTRLDVAFSRDQRTKVYVQHRMEERGADLWTWLEDGACLYVCGNASQMAPDVHAALIRVVEAHGQRSREEAESYLEQLRKAKRYQRDVY